MVTGLSKTSTISHFSTSVVTLYRAGHGSSIDAVDTATSLRRSIDCFSVGSKHSAVSARIGNDGPWSAAAHSDRILTFVSKCKYRMDNCSTKALGLCDRSSER